MSTVQLPVSFFYGSVATKPAGGDSMLIDKNTGNVTFFRGALMLHVDRSNGLATIQTGIGSLDQVSAIKLADEIASSFGLGFKIGRSAGPCYRFDLTGPAPKTEAERSLV